MVACAFHQLIHINNIRYENIGESQWEPPDFEFECEETVSTLSCDVGDAHDDCVEEEEEGPGPESGDDAGMAMAMMALIAAPDHEGARREEKENEEEMGTEEVEQLHDGGHKFAETDVPMDAEDFVQQAIADWIDEDSNNQEEEVGNLLASALEFYYTI